MSLLLAFVIGCWIFTAGVAVFTLWAWLGKRKAENDLEETLRRYHEDIREKK